MNPFLSWGIVLVIVGSYWFANTYRKNVESRNRDSNDRSTGGVYLGSEKSQAATSGGESEKKKKRKRAAKETQKKPAAASTSDVKVKVNVEKAVEPKVAVHDEDDDDEAVEEDAVAMARSLAQLRGGKPIVKPEEKKKPAPQQSQQFLHPKPPLSPLATASQTSSTGADADIDEESLADTSAIGGSNDPSDMLEGPAPGPRVLTITPSTAPPRVSKQRSNNNQQPSQGAQYSKNQRKREKQKAAKAEERAAQEAAREKYRAEQRAQGIMSTREMQRSFASNAGGKGDAWTVAGAGGRPKALQPQQSSSVSREPILLDTFATPAPSSSTTTNNNTQRPSGPISSSSATHSESEPQPERRIFHASRIDDSVWEDVPATLMEEPVWNTVSSKKGKKVKSAGSDTGAESAREVVGNTTTTTTGKSARNERRNGYEALGASSASDWAEVEAWEAE